MTYSAKEMGGAAVLSVVVLSVDLFANSRKESVTQPLSTASSSLFMSVLSKVISFSNWNSSAEPCALVELHSVDVMRANVAFHPSAQSREESSLRLM